MKKLLLTILLIFTVQTPSPIKSSVDKMRSVLTPTDTEFSSRLDQVSKLDRILTEPEDTCGDNSTHAKYVCELQDARDKMAKLIGEMESLLPGVSSDGERGVLKDELGKLRPFGEVKERRACVSDY